MDHQSPDEIGRATQKREEREALCKGREREKGVCGVGGWRSDVILVWIAVTISDRNDLMRAQPCEWKYLICAITAVKGAIKWMGLQEPIKTVPSGGRHTTIEKGSIAKTSGFEQQGGRGRTVALMAFITVSIGWWKKRKRRLNPCVERERERNLRRGGEEIRW